VAEFDTKCNECNKAVSADFSNNTLYTDICQSCRDVYESDAQDRGHQLGVEEGKEEAKDDYDSELINYLEIRDRLTS